MSERINFLSKKTEIWYQIEQKIIMKNDKERLRKQARDKYRNLSEEKIIKRENIDKTYTAICLKKRNKDLKNIKKIIVRPKSLNIIMNKIVLHIIYI